MRTLITFAIGIGIGLCLFLQHVTTDWLWAQEV